MLSSRPQHIRRAGPYIHANRMQGIKYIVHAFNEKKNPPVKMGEQGWPYDI
jgi:hypothetical protein